ncbi:MAG: peptidase M64 [Bacteroidales bacterium]|nr:peptidase M64 [Bacteroidales bacterium]
MKYSIFIVLFVLSFTANAQFSKYFYNKTLRVDYFHSGNYETEFYTFGELIEEPYWGGSKINLLDTFEFGNYYIKVFDIDDDKLIYSRGYSTIFNEWQTTDEAKKTSRSFSESVVIPYPKNDVRVEFFSRNKKGIFEKKFEYFVDTDDYFISPKHSSKYPMFDIFISGEPSSKVDIVILPEGYTQDEMGKFVNDCKIFAEDFFSFSPYSENKDKFNIRGILAPSKDSGSDIPADSVWKNTLLNSRFYTFDLERYCMTTDFLSVRDLAANAPYDQIFIMINTPKYGGGAVYNFYSVCGNSNSLNDKILIHEFGHGFAGLGDEYFTSDVAYNDFYPMDVEPWEPNLTTLVDFDKKWRHLLKKKTPIPTPIDKRKFLKRLGVFEGGGYSAKGVYRPAYDCLMNSFKGNKFCGACNEAIINMINFYTKE